MCFNCGRPFNNSLCPCSTSDHHQRQVSPTYSAYIDPDLVDYGISANTPSIHLNGTAPSHHSWAQPQQPSLAIDQHLTAQWNTDSQNEVQISWSSYTTASFRDDVYNTEQTRSLVRDPLQDSDQIEGYLSGLEGLQKTPATLAHEHDPSQGQAYPVEDDDKPFLDNTSPAEASSQFLTVLPFRQEPGSVTYTGSNGFQDSRTSMSSGPLSSITSNIGEESTEPRHQCLVCPKSYKHRSSLRKHMASHNSPSDLNLRRYPCGSCHQSFPYPKDRDRHLLTHDPHASRLHKCTFVLCQYYEKGFLRRDHLLRHLRDQHDGAQAPPIL